MSLTTHPVIAAKQKPWTKRVRFRAFAFEERTPPAEIQLWSYGSNPTDYGVHEWTDRSIAEVVARYNERGNPLLVDVEHNGATLDDGEPAQTGGYARLEIRDKAPWLVFDWSAFGAEQIATGQRRFLSPEYDLDPDTNEITRLYRVSLVADPGTYRARVLASADIQTQKIGAFMDPNVTAILGILNSVSDPAEALTAIKGFIESLGTGDSADVVDPPADGVAAPAFAEAADDDKKKPPIAAAAPVPVAATVPAAAVVAAAPVAVSAAALEADAEAIKIVKAYAEQSKSALRDQILMRDGHRLAPSVRQWASSQSLDVVRGLCAAAPEAAPAPARVSATRGAGQGTVQAVGLQGAELEELQRSMGTFKASTPSTPHMAGNDFVLPTLTPTEHRRILAAAAAKGDK